VGLARSQGEHNDLAERLYRESEGNPFFLGELIRERLDQAGRPASGSASSEGDVHTAAGETVQLGKVRSLIESRVARLSPPTRDLAEIAAVVGQGFDTELLREVSGWDEHQVLDALDELLDRQLIREAGSLSLIDYAFSHHLIQVAIYATVAPSRRERRHRRIAQVLEEIAGERRDQLAADLARHFDLGGEAQTAAGYYLEAAQRALQVYADSEAIEYLNRALELSHDATLRFRLLALREAIHRRRGERDTQASDLEELKALAQLSGNEEAICETAHREILLQRALGERHVEANLIASLKERANVHGLPRWQAMALELEGEHLILVSQYETAHRPLESALEIWTMLHDAEGQARCYALLAEAAVLQGKFDETEQLLQRGSLVGGMQVNQSVLIATLRSAVRAALVRQEFETVSTLGQRLLELCRKIGDRAGEAEAHTRLAAAASRRFLVAEARQHYSQADVLFNSLGDRKGQAAVLVNSGMLAGNLGHFAEAIGASERAELIFAGLGDVHGQTVSALNIAWNSWQLLNYAEAKSAAERALSLAQSMQSQLFEAFALANLGAVEREQGNLPQAIEHMRAGLAIRRKMAQPIEIAGDLCDLAIAYLRADDIAAAQEAVREMREIAAAHPDQMAYPQYILWATAQTSRAMGHHEQAAQLLAEAVSVVFEKASAIADAESRATYLQMSFNREILAAQQHDTWPA
jgi:tetratricopeptide (TPR) repeat protein